MLLLRLTREDRIGGVLRGGGRARAFHCLLDGNCRLHAITLGATEKSSINSVPWVAACAWPEADDCRGRHKRFASGVADVCGAGSDHQAAQAVAAAVFRSDKGQRGLTSNA